MNLLRNMSFLAAVFCVTLVTQCQGEEVPDTFKVKFETSCGDFVVQVDKALAPHGANRFHELVKSGFYDECRFFRVVPGFVVQFGINGDPQVQKKWVESKIKDDPAKVSNTKGTVTFATAGPNTRTTQLFVNYGKNDFLDTRGFSPFGKVVEGMDVVEKIYSKDVEKPKQDMIQAKGNEYLKENFPNLDYIKKATIVKDDKK